MLFCDEARRGVGLILRRSECTSKASACVHCCQVTSNACNRHVVKSAKHIFLDLLCALSCPRFSCLIFLTHLLKLCGACMWRRFVCVGLYRAGAFCFGRHIELTKGKDDEPSTRMAAMNPWMRCELLASCSILFKLVLNLRITSSTHEPAWTNCW